VLRSVLETSKTFSSFHQLEVEQASLWSVAPIDVPPPPLNVVHLCSKAVAFKGQKEVTFKGSPPAGCLWSPDVLSFLSFTTVENFSCLPLREQTHHVLRTLLVNDSGEVAIIAEVVRAALAGIVFVWGGADRNVKAFSGGTKFSAGNQDRCI